MRSATRTTITRQLLQRRFSAPAVLGAPLGPTASVRATGTSSSAPVSGGGASMPPLNTATLGDMSNVDLPDLGDVQTENVPRASFAELEGPWVALAGPLQGELFVKPDGFCYFRPGDSLGQGIGALQVKETAAGVATVSVDLEVYRYEQTARDPPANPEVYSITAVLTRATSSVQGYSTLTLSGHLHKDKQHLGQFNAAKMEPWTRDAARDYVPNAQIAEGFKVLFPEPLRLGQQARPPLDLEKYRVSDVNSVYYVPDYISAPEEDACLAQLAATPKELKRDLDRRVVQEYGGQMCPECNASFVADVNQPPWTDEMCNALVHDKVFTPTTFPNNVRIHEYAVGHGIAPHVDGPIYVPRVAIVSLQHSVVMGFYPHRKPYDDAMEHYNDTFRFDSDIAQQRPHFSLVLEPRSLLVFDADAYYFHPHGISDKSVDSLLESDAGPIANRHLLTQTPADATSVERKPRVGVTIRNLLPRCNHAPERNEYCMRRVWDVAHPGKIPSNPTPNSITAASSTPTPKPAAGSKPVAPASSSNKFGSMSQAPAGGFQRSSSTSSTASQTSAPMTAAAASSVASGDALEEVNRKLDQVIATQIELQNAVKQLQVIAAHSATQQSSFQTEVSGVLDHLTTTILDVQASVTTDED